MREEQTPFPLFVRRSSAHGIKPELRRKNNFQVKMGSTPSTPNRESSDTNSASDSPWWQIENQILELNPNRMDASPDDPNSSSNRSEPDQQQATPNEETETLISDHFECESASANEDKMHDDVASNESSENGATTNERQQSLEEFKEELRIKRELRTNAIAELRNELSSLRRQLAHEKEINKQLIEERRDRQSLCEICSSIYKSLEHNNDDDVDNGVNGNSNSAATAAVATAESQTTTITLRTHLAEVQFALQNANAEILRISGELTATRQQAKSLKEVIAVSKEMLEIRETELSQVRDASTH